MQNYAEIMTEREYKKDPPYFQGKNIEDMQNERLIYMEEDAETFRRRKIMVYHIT